MKNIRAGYKVSVAACAVLAIVMIQSVGTSIASGPPSLASALTDADLNSEERALDAFLIDIGKLDKRRTELGKKSSLTRAEFDSLESTSDGLKRRVAGIQNTLRQVVAKLKASGQWDTIDQTVAARVNDQVFQDFVSRVGFKKALEDAASRLNSNADEIGAPLDILRNRVKAQVNDSGLELDNASLAGRAVRVGFKPARVVADQNLRCRLVSIHYGIHGFIHGNSTTKLNLQTNCYCKGDQNACDQL